MRGNFHILRLGNGIRSSAPTDRDEGGLRPLSLAGQISIWLGSEKTARAFAASGLKIKPHATLVNPLGRRLWRGDHGGPEAIR